MSIQEAQQNTLIYKTLTVALRARYLGKLSHIKDKQKIKQLVNHDPVEAKNRLRKKLGIKGYE